MGDRRTILIVEDDADLIACLEAVLEADRYEVLTAGDGATALRACQRSPSLALVDLHIPGELSGGELVSALRRSLPQGARLVLLSGERNLAHFASVLGADGFLEKPFDIDDLLRIVDGLPPDSTEALAPV